MEQHYFVSLFAVEKHMQKQFAEADEREAAELAAEPVQEPRLTRARLRMSNALYGLAASLNPELPVPTREIRHQH